MKRLISMTKQTRNFMIDTDAELKLIESKDSRLKRQKLINFSKKENEGVTGGIFYEAGNEKISLYVVEIFIYKDIEPKLGNQKDAVVYIATKLDKEGNADTNYQYVKIEEYGSKIFISNVKNVTVEGMGLVKLNSNTFDKAMEELKTIFENFEIV